MKKPFQMILAAALMAAPLTFAGEAAKAQPVDSHPDITCPEGLFPAVDQFGSPFCDWVPSEEDGLLSTPSPEDQCFLDGGLSFTNGQCNFPLPEGEEEEVVEPGDTIINNTRNVDRSTTVEGDQINPSVENTAVSRNRNVNRNRQVNRNNQSINIQQAPQAVVAPTAPATAPGRVGDVIVPLPTVGVSAFGSRDNNVFGSDTERSTYGIQAGFSVPLGTSQTRRAAEQVIAQRDAALRFQLIQEATYMLQQGVLSEEVHPEHWAALYGTPVETVSFEAE